MAESRPSDEGAVDNGTGRLRVTPTPVSAAALVADHVMPEWAASGGQGWNFDNSWFTRPAVSGLSGASWPLVGREFVSQLPTMKDSLNLAQLSADVARGARSWTWISTSPGPGRWWPI
jgi:hypothetical protein